MIAAGRAAASSDLTASAQAVPWPGACGFIFGGVFSWSRTFRTPETPRSALRRGIRWLSYFRVPESVTVPCITTALIPEPPPSERCNRRSTSFCRALSALAFPPNMVRSLRDRREEGAAVQNARRAGRGIDHRGRGRTVKEDLPSGFILLGFRCCRSGKSESIGERLRIDGRRGCRLQPELLMFDWRNLMAACDLEPAEPASRWSAYASSPIKAQ